MPERQIAYQLVNQKQDTGFSLTAPSLERLYIDGALALTDFLVKLDRIQATDTRQVTVGGKNRDELMSKWVGEILSLFEKDRFLARRIIFRKFDGKQIEATLFGEKFDSIRHGGSPNLRSLIPQNLQISDKMDPEPQFSLRIMLGESKAA